MCYKTFFGWCHIYCTDVLTYPYKVSEALELCCLPLSMCPICSKAIQENRSSLVISMAMPSNDYRVFLAKGFPFTFTNIYFIQDWKIIFGVYDQKQRTVWTVNDVLVDLYPFIILVNPHIFRAIKGYGSTKMTKVYGSTKSLLTVHVSTINVT